MPANGNLYHCHRCEELMDKSMFYPSSIQRKIHVCKDHLQQNARRWVRDHPPRPRMPTADRKARNVRVLMKKYARGVYGQHPLPEWMTRRNIRTILERYGFKSALSATKQGLVLVPRHGNLVPRWAVKTGDESYSTDLTSWLLEDAVPVTRTEARLYVREPREVRESQVRVQQG
jgi:hypothetical protein